MSVFGGIGRLLRRGSKKNAGRTGGAPVYIKHANKLSDEESFELQSIMEKFTARSEGMADIKMMSVDVDAYRQSGGRKKYSMRAALHIGPKTVMAKSHGWDLSWAAHEIVTSLKKQMVREKRMSRTAKRRSRRNSKV